MNKCVLCTGHNLISLTQLPIKYPKPCQYCQALLNDLKIQINSSHSAAMTHYSKSSPIIAPFYHEGLCKILTHKFKYNRQLIYGRILTGFLIEKLRSYYHYNQYPDMIIPIPSHNSRIIERHFSHTGKLAHWISTAMKIPQNNLLKRIKNTPQQAGLSKNQRLKNIENAFAITSQPQHSKCYPIKYALIDDVITTGATTDEAQRTLNSTFPHIQIDVWSLTYTQSV